MIPTLPKVPYIRFHIPIQTSNMDLTDAVWLLVFSSRGQWHICECWQNPCCVSQVISPYKPSIRPTPSQASRINVPRSRLQAHTRLTLPCLDPISGCKRPGDRLFCSIALDQGYDSIQTVQVGRNLFKLLVR